MNIPFIQTNNIDKILKANGFKVLTPLEEEQAEVDAMFDQANKELDELRLAEIEIEETENQLADTYAETNI